MSRSGDAQRAEQKNDPRFDTSYGYADAQEHQLPGVTLVANHYTIP
jgi:hypothetical protein